MKKGNWKIASILALALLMGGCSAQAEGNVEPQAENVGETGQSSSAMEQSSYDVEQNSGGEVEGTLTVTFLDVGQGNAVLVESDGEYMLIDGGDRDYSSFVVSYLKNAGVDELDYVISSHYDADHLNGVVGVLNAFPCETVLASDYVTDTRVYESFCEVIEEKDIDLLYPAVGDSYVLGDAKFTVVCPDNYDYSDVNDNSIGVRIEHGENSFLICGDAGEKSEEAMLQSGVVLDSDVYLASHHGSDGSSSWEFLQAVSPEVVVISVGENNSYGHPTERVLSDVATLGAEIYRTDLQGTIVVTSDGQELSWNVDAVSTSSNNSQSETMEETATGTQSSDTQFEEQTYVLNRNTKKFHYPSCSSAEDISAENRAEFTGTREELIGAGYESCKRCNP